MQYRRLGHDDLEVLSEQDRRREMPRFEREKLARSPIDGIGRSTGRTPDRVKLR